MAVQFLKNTLIYWGANDVSGRSNQVHVTASPAMLDVTTFGADTVTNLSGLLKWQVSASGFWDTGNSGVAPGAPDPDFFTGTGAGGTAVSIVPDNIDGGVAFFANETGAKYTYLGKLGQAIPYTLDMENTGYVTRGVVGIQPSSRTSTFTGTARNLGAVTSAQALAGALHVVAFSGTSLTVIVQSSPDNTFAAPTTQIAFTVATGRTSQWLAATSPITDTWFRAKATLVGTSYTALVNFGIASIL